MKNYKQIRFPIIKIFLTATIFFIIGIFSFTFAVIFITPHKKQICVPNLIGKDYTQAIKILKKQGLKSKVIFKYSNTIAKNRVISQLPSPKKQVRIGRQIELNVSKGPALIEVPDITNLTLLKAENVLARAGKGNIKGLKIGKITYVHSAQMENTIIAQNPACGEIIPKNLPINVLVSLGTEQSTFFMPDLIGLKLEEAIYSLKKLGLILQEVEHKVGEEGIENDIVLKHTPCAQTKVSKKDLVTLVVSIKKNKEKVEYRHAFIRYKVPDGFYNYQIKILINDYQGIREVFNQKRAPGSKIEFMIQVIGEAKASIYLDNILKEEKQL